MTLPVLLNEITQEPAGISVPSVSASSGGSTVRITSGVSGSHSSSGDTFIRCQAIKAVSCSKISSGGMPLSVRYASSWSAKAASPRMSSCPASRIALATDACRRRTVVFAVLIYSSDEDGDHLPIISMCSPGWPRIDAQDVKVGLSECPDQKPCTPSINNRSESWHTSPVWSEFITFLQLAMSL